MAIVHPSIRRAATRFRRAVVDTVYPRTCAGCGMRGLWLCEYCDTETLRLNVTGSCARCGEPTLGGRCGCVDLPHTIGRARAAVVYDGWAAHAVKRMKYHGEPDRADHLAGMMIPLLSMLGHVDGLVPVPLHVSKQKERGFNQSLLLAEKLSLASGIPVLNVLVRTKKTISQTTLSGRDRRTNVAGAFGLDPEWYAYPGGRYVLIDDVRTTGATLGACAATLAIAAPDAVSVLTFALDMQQDEVSAYRDYLKILRAGTPTP